MTGEVYKCSSNMFAQQPTISIMSPGKFPVTLLLSSHSYKSIPINTPEKYAEKKKKWESLV